MIITFILLVISLCCLFYLLKLLRIFYYVKKFPGMPGILLFGPGWDFGSDLVNNFRVFRKYNEIFPTGYRLTFMHVAIILVTTAEHAEIILSNVKYNKKEMAYNLLHPWLKTGLLTSNGEKWTQRRKLLTPAFHFNILKKFINNFADNNKILLDVLAEESKKDETDVMPLMSTIALNFICSTSMGIDLNIYDKKQVNEYKSAIYKFSEIAHARFTTPWNFSDFIFKFSPNYKIQEKVRKTLHDFTSKFITKREETFDEKTLENIETESSYSSKKKLAMLDLLLYQKRKNGLIDDEGIREEVDTFTFEGHDTVSVAISFALLLFANHKEHQKKIIQEVDEIFGDSKRDPTYQDLQNMQYLELCLKESLRLFPSVPMIARDIEEDIHLENDLVIPKGAMVTIQIFDIHRKEIYYPKPNEFIPERFLPENSKNRHPYAFIPFSAGPRNCIGQKYAMLEMKNIFSTIFRYYEVEARDKVSDITLISDLILRSQTGIHVKFVSRNK